jgi:hypothetical protein
MTASNVDHKDVAAYALGVLDDREAELFEAHLAECAQCGAELEQLTMVSTLLSHVDADSLAIADRSTQDAQVLDRMLNVVSFQRSRAKTRQMFAVAACILALIAGAFFGVVGGKFIGSDENTGGQNVADGGTPKPSPSASPTPSASPSNNRIGITGEQFEATDPTSGLSAKLGLEEKGWGTQVSLSLTKVQGPLKCQLVAISKKSGQTDTAMSWSVPDEGYGTDEQPNPLVLQGGTALSRAELDRFEVRTVDGTTLVSIPV